MKQQMTKEEIQIKAKKIDAIYKEYLKKIHVLRNKQNEIIKKFIADLEKRRIDEIRNKIINIK